MAARAVVFAALVVALPAAALDVGSRRGFLTSGYAAGMRPEEVAKTLVGVEDRWENMASSFLACEGVANSTGAGHVECDGFSGEFTRSCAMVASSMVKGSGGQRDVVKEYMGAVCGASSLQDGRRERCQLLAVEVDAAMTDDAYYNRVQLDLTSACHKFWSKLTAAAKVRADKEEAERAEEKKRQAEEQKKAEEKRAVEAAEAAEAKRQEAELAAAEAKRHAAEEAGARAAEARTKAEEAAKHLENAKADWAALANEAAKKAQAHVKEAVEKATKSALAPKANVSEAVANAAGNDTASHPLAAANETGAAAAANMTNGTVSK